MKKAWHIVLAIALVNLAAIDIMAWQMDQYLLAVRDSQCKFQDELAQLKGEKIITNAGAKPVNGLPLLWLAPSRNSFTLMEISFADHGALHLYGCDANGKRYRMWLQK